jgi:DNA repair exonuclease SbcCD ATPase subunit
MKSIQGLKRDVKEAVDRAQVDRRRAAMEAALDGDAQALAALVQGAELDQILEHADEIRKITARLENARALFGDVDELKARAEAARTARLEAVAQEQAHFNKMKAELGALIAEHSELAGRVQSADRDQRRLLRLCFCRRPFRPPPLPS